MSEEKDLESILEDSKVKPSEIYKLPLNLSIVGSTGVGKTYRLKQILKDHMLPQADWLIIFCPTMQFSGDYDEFVENIDPESTKLKIAKVETDYENITAEIIESQTELVLNNKKDDVPQVICIFDDCLGSKMMGNYGMLSNFSAKSRHLNISMVFVSQRISGISRTIRLNSGVFILFSNFNHSENESWITQYVPKKYKSVMMDKLNQIFNVKYQFLLANNRESKVLSRLLINGEKIINFDAIQ